ncbi:MAG: ABC transporter permease subunit [Roseovarius sp.]|nr:ABC transporter permease subunit [Roseovarius sp.]
MIVSGDMQAIPAPRRQRAGARAERVWAWVEPVLVWSPAGLLLIPLIFLAIGSFTARWDSRGLSGLSLDAYTTIWPTAQGEIGFSLLLAIGVSTINLLLGVPLGVRLAQGGRRGHVLIKAIVSMPIVLPPMIVAMGLVLAWPRLIGSWEILMLAHLVWTFPFAVWPVMTAMMALDAPTLAAAARTLGASDWAIFTRVVLPNLRNAILLAWSMTFIMSFAEINGSLFLASAGSHPVGVGLLESFLNLEIRVAAAYTVLFLLVLTPVFLLTVRRSA